MVRMFKRFGIDMVKDPVLVFPTLHYQNGGVETDPEGSSTVEGLFVAGEISGGVHGKNRLMGNSTLDCMVFGRRAGVHSAEYVKKGVKTGKLGLKHVKEYIKELKSAGLETERKSPMLLPDYRGKATLARSIDIF
jgi:succinate dehydrogenase / fumarate reductase flavoprotein subunit